MLIFKFLRIAPTDTVPALQVPVIARKIIAGSVKHIYYQLGNYYVQGVERITLKDQVQEHDTPCYHGFSQNSICCS